jgi:hypothetical protein
MLSGYWCVSTHNTSADPIKTDRDRFQLSIRPILRLESKFHRIADVGVQADPQLPQDFVGIGRIMAFLSD